MIVSGSRDLTCILWDMEELSYVTQLAGHSSSISALAINELTVSPPIESPFLVILYSHSTFSSVLCHCSAHTLFPKSVPFVNSSRVLIYPFSSGYL